MSNTNLHQKWYKIKLEKSVYEDNQELSTAVLFHLKKRYKSNTCKRIAQDLDLNLYNVRNWFYKNTGLTAFELLRIMDKYRFIRHLLGYYRIMESRSATGKKNRKEMRLKILEILKENPKMTINKLAQVIGATPKAIEYQLYKLVAEKMVIRVGTTKNGMWLVQNNKYG